MTRLKLTASIAAAGLTVLLVCGVAPAAAATYHVTVAATGASDVNPGDGTCEATVSVGDCNLRAAVQEANAGATSLDMITFQSSLGEIDLGSVIPITDPVTIDGTGSGSAATDTVVDGNDTVRLFDVFAAAATTTFKDMRIRNGYAEDESGGAIRTGATTTLDNVVLDSSESFANLLPVFGGAISNESTAATLTIQNSVISNNTISFDAGRNAAGGGIASHGPLVVTNSVVSDNSIAGSGDDALGGGIFANDDLTIADSTIEGNDVQGNADVAGGGIFDSSNSSANSLTNSTVSGNDGGGGAGGVHLGDHTDITNVTFKNNTGGNPDGQDLIQFGGTATVQNTIFDNLNACDEELTGAIASAIPGHNIDADDTCGFGVTQGNMENTDPMLQTGLVQFGTPPGQSIHFAFATSPAIDNADPSCGGSIPFDQRGIERPQGPACDIGAYERDYRDLTVTVTGSGTVSGPGINCISGSGDCTDEFLDDSPSIVLTATPAAGFQFASWDGCTSATGNQCTLNTGNDRMVSATFTAIPSTGGGGTTTPTPTPSKKCKKGQKLKKGKCVKKKKKKRKK
jgi:hypothetical protein